MLTAKPSSAAVLPDALTARTGHIAGVARWPSTAADDARAVGLRHKKERMPEG